MTKYIIVIWRYPLHRQLLKEIVKIVFNAFKSYKPPKNTTATVVMEGALGLSMTDFHEKIIFLNDAFYKVYLQQKFACSLH
jgi:hypothetical protein